MKFLAKKYFISYNKQNTKETLRRKNGRKIYSHFL